MLRSILNVFLKKPAAPDHSDERQIEYLNNDADADGFSWDQVQRIAAYRVDSLTTDLVYLEFELQNLKTYVTHEELPGFEAFRRVLAREFPCIDRDWYLKLMQPAIAANYTVLYERDGSRPQATPAVCAA